MRAVRQNTITNEPQGCATNRQGNESRRRWHCRVLRVATGKRDAPSSSDRSALSQARKSRCFLETSSTCASPTKAQVNPEGLYATQTTQFHSAHVSTQLDKPLATEASDTATPPLPREHANNLPLSHGVRAGVSDSLQISPVREQVTTPDEATIPPLSQARNSSCDDEPHHEAADTAEQLSQTVCVRQSDAQAREQGTSARESECVGEPSPRDHANKLLLSHGLPVRSSSCESFNSFFGLSTAGLSSKLQSLGGDQGARWLTARELAQVGLQQTPALKDIQEKLALHDKKVCDLETLVQNGTSLTTIDYLALKANTNRLFQTKMKASALRAFRASLPFTSLFYESDIASFDNGRDGEGAPSLATGTVTRRETPRASLLKVESGAGPVAPLGVLQRSHDYRLAGPSMRLAVLLKGLTLDSDRIPPCVGGCHHFCCACVQRTPWPDVACYKARTLMRLYWADSPKANAAPAETGLETLPCSSVRFSIPCPPEQLEGAKCGAQGWGEAGRAAAGRTGSGYVDQPAGAVPSTVLSSPTPAPGASFPAPGAPPQSPLTTLSTEVHLITRRFALEGGGGTALSERM